MRCPFCQRDNDRVLDTRALEDGYSIRRRRQCNSCRRRFTTFERIEQPSIRVIKKDASRQPFDRERIRMGIERACWKRPVSSEAMQHVVQLIESEVHAHYEMEVDSRTIGEIVMRHLAALDEVASVRFASVYRDFNSASDFIRALSRSPPPSD
jgi:transcriptional repressor NrdR